MNPTITDAFKLAILEHGKKAVKGGDLVFTRTGESTFEVRLLSSHETGRQVFMSVGPFTLEKGCDLTLTPIKGLFEFNLR